MRSHAHLSPGFLVWRTSMKWRAATDRALAPLGLTHAQYSLLAALYGLSRTGRRPSQRQLADFTGLEPVYVSRLARALERAGLVERPDDPEDPRAVQLALTERGAQVAVEAIDTIRGLLEDLTAPLGGTRSTRTQELVATLQALLDAPET